MTIEERLAENIDVAIRTLAPKFDVTAQQLATFRKPISRLSQRIGNNRKSRGMFNADAVRFDITPEGLDNPEVLGEEVSHYFHKVLNPGLSQEIVSHGIHKKEYWLGIALQELVGGYGKIVYSVLSGQPFLPISVGDFNFGQLLGLIKRLNDTSCPDAIWDLDDYAHEMGYKRAEVAFRKHEELLLPRLVRMSLDEAVETLPRLLPVTIYEKKVLPILDKITR